MPKITIQHPDGERSKFELNKRLVSIGRGPDNDIVLPDGSSSSNHAVLKMNSEGDFGVTDLGSTNHTKVNGAKVTTAELLDGDEIYFGDTRVIYTSDQSTGKGGTQRKALTGGSATSRGSNKPSSPQSFSPAERAAGGLAKPKDRDPESGGAGGCFALLMLPLALVVSLFIGMSVRHYIATDGKLLPQEWFGLIKEAQKDTMAEEPEN